ncbi:MAG: radical SAM protein [Elusimicrobia bacterium]|nr:radical SAM protein [Elusimicrobiota bacterium]
MQNGKIKKMEQTLTYRYQDGLYLNLTNRCPTACKFCIKFTWEMNYRGYDLKLNGKETPVSEFIESFEKEKKIKPFSEVVFCGYGESTYRLQEMVQIAKYIKNNHPSIKVRLNTIGLGNLIWGRNIAPDLQGGLDAVSISLNTADPSQWVEIHQPAKPYREKGFESVLEFIRCCVPLLPETTVTAIEQPGVDVSRCRDIALKVGAHFRSRPWLE